MPVRTDRGPTDCPESDFDKPFERDYLLELFDYNNVDSVFSGHTHFEKMDIPKLLGASVLCIRRKGHRSIFLPSLKKANYYIGE